MRTASERSSSSSERIAVRAVDRTLRLLAIVGLPLAGLPAQAIASQIAPVVAPVAARAETAESVRVHVSRRTVRIVFPRDTSHAWGWSARQDPNYIPQYLWGVIVEGMDGTRTLAVRALRAGAGARTFASLERLIDAARAEYCSPGMIGQCTHSGLRATVERGRVVLAMQDSARIARLFGMRPPFVGVWHQRPEDAYRVSQDSVRVEYEAPQIPVPDSATRADAARSRRRFEESIHSIYRYITSGESAWEPLWLVADDSTEVSLGEMQCTYDSCVSGYAALTDSRWTVLDHEVARLTAVASDSRDGSIRFSLRGPTRYLKALRPGRTTLRVIGVHGPSDTAAASTPPARELTREIVVTRPIRRVEILPRPDTVRAREPFTLRVRVIDNTGEVLEGLPVKLDVLDGDRARRDASKPVDLAFTAPGRTRIVARLGTRADTVTVMVVDSIVRR